MKFSPIVICLLLGSLVAVPVVRAEELAIKSGDTLHKIMEDKKGKRVTLRLQGGEELTGKVRAITKELVQLGELSGREYFDAVVEISRISAVIIRTKD